MDNYYLKYLKYKNKYIDLKQKIGGSQPPPQQPQQPPQQPPQPPPPPPPPAPVLKRQNAITGAPRDEIIEETIIRYHETNDIDMLLKIVNKNLAHESVGVINHEPATLNEVEKKLDEILNQQNQNQN